jgi:hypothetical protein
MLSAEVAQFYGVKDGPPCADFVAFINGMLGFAEANRRECWDQLCLGLINIQTKFKALQASNSELEAKSKQSEQKLKDLQIVYDQSMALNARLNHTIAVLRQSAAKTSPPPPAAAAEAPKVQLELATPNAPPPGAKPDLPRAKRAFPEATVPDSDEEQGPPAKRDKSETIIDLKNKIAGLMMDNEHKSETIVELRKKTTSLATENERLDRLLASLKKADAPPAETGKIRLSQEEMSRLRKSNAELEATLSRLTEEARLQVHQHTEHLKEKIKENDAAWVQERSAWGQERLELTRRIEELSKPNTGGTARIEDLSGGVVPSGYLIPSVFLHAHGALMAFPVPIRTGRIMSLIDIYKSWTRYPSDNEGTFFATIVCPFTKQITSLASVEEVTLLHSIASDLRLYTIPPLRFQYYMNGGWIDFTIIDQIVIAALCCKLYRHGTSRTVENVMVKNNDFIFMMQISDNEVDFQMQSVQNRTKTIPACLVECVPPDFFQRWTFSTGSSGYEVEALQ